MRTLQFHLCENAVGQTSSRDRKLSHDELTTELFRSNAQKPFYDDRSFLVIWL